MLKKKKEYAIEHLEKSVTKMECPKCRASFRLDTTGSLVCKNAHRYDISKKGVLHFPLHHMSSDYDTHMLEARRKMIRKGLYAPLMEELAKKLAEVTDEQLIVDMGSGEGSMLYDLATTQDIKGQKMGYDLSKDGVLLSSDYAKEASWFVGDVTNMPFKNTSVDILLNILSPCHYEEINRVLKDDGILIKVIPESGYLQELRSAFFLENKDKQTYSNEKVYKKFSQDMKIMEEHRLTYEYFFEDSDYNSVLKMSPLHWGASEIALEQAYKHPFQKVTIDVKILIGKKH